MLVGLQGWAALCCSMSFSSRSRCHLLLGLMKRQRAAAAAQGRAHHWMCTISRASCHLPCQQRTPRYVSATWNNTLHMFACHSLLIDLMVTAVPAQQSCLLTPKHTCSTPSKHLLAAPNWTTRAQHQTLAACSSSGWGGGVNAWCYCRLQKPR